MEKDLSNEEFNLSTFVKFKRISGITEYPSSIQHMFICNNFLAIGRSNGTIDIWDTKNWIQVTKINGYKNIDIRKLILIDKNYNKEKSNILYENFYNDYTLVSIGLCGILVQWNLLTGKVENYYTNPGGPIWDIKFFTDKKLFYLASNDGSVRIIGLDKGFYSYNQLPSYISPVFSIDLIKDEEKSIIVCCGYKNGSINKFENNVLKMTFGNKTYNLDSSYLNKNSYNDNESLDSISNKKNVEISSEIIWCLKFIDSKYIASGNANGNLQIWDIEYGVMFQQFKEHNNDILCIEYNKINKILYYSGINSIVYSINLLNDKFKITSNIRPQSHDINSLILLNSDCLLSGGISTDICLINLNRGRFLEKFSKKTNKLKRHISCFDQKQPYKIVKDNFSNILILQKLTNKLLLYKACNNSIKEEFEFLIELNSKSDSNILSIDMLYLSNKEIYIVYSDIQDTILYRYNKEENLVKKLIKFNNYCGNYIYLLYNNDENIINIIIVNNLKIVMLNYSIKNNSFDEFCTKYFEKKNIILSCNFDNESNTLVITFLSDYLNNKIQIYQIECNNCIKNISNMNIINNCSLESNVSLNNKLITKSCFFKDSYNKRYIFICDSLNEIYFISNANNSVHYIIKNISYYNSNKLKCIYPKNLLTWYNKIMGIIQINNNLLIAYTDYNFIPILLNQDVPEKSNVIRDISNRSKNKNLESIIRSYHNRILSYSTDSTYKETEGYTIDNNNVNRNYSITTKFISNVYMQYINNNVIVVESNWNNILENMPNPIVKHKFGK